MQLSTSGSKIQLHQLLLLPLKICLSHQTTKHKKRTSCTAPAWSEPAHFRIAFFRASVAGCSSEAHMSNRSCATTNFRISPLRLLEPVEMRELWGFMVSKTHTGQSERRGSAVFCSQLARSLFTFFIVSFYLASSVLPPLLKPCQRLASAHTQHQPAQTEIQDALICK